MSASQHRRQSQLTQHAHLMRTTPSVLWQALRAGQISVQFRRQVVVRGYLGARSIAHLSALARPPTSKARGEQQGRQETEQECPSDF
jgi:hypothetical protein